MEWERDQAFAEFQPALSKVEEEAAQMYSRDDRKVFLVLLAEAKSRIFADYQRASGKLKTLLLNMMTRLIDSQLTVKAALREARLTYNCSADFQRVTGMRPRDYVEYHRLRLGQGILRYTGVRLYTIANTVGYTYQSQFSKNFGKKLGHRPKDEPKADPDEVRSLLKGMPTELLNPGSLPDPGRSPNTVEETIARPAAAGMEEFWAEASRIIREHGSPELLARTLQQGGEIYDSWGFTDRAIPLFLEALDLSQVIADPFVVFSAHFNLTYLYTRISKPAEAAAQYEEVKKLRPTVEISPFHLAWLEGAVRSVNGRYDLAESAFLEAKEGFIAQGFDLYAALSILELSLIYLEQGKVQRAFSTASSTIPPISRYSCHKEAISAVAILQKAARAEGIEKSALRQVLNHLESIRKDPAANSCRGVNPWGRE